MYDDSWEDFRESMLEYSKNRLETLIKVWLNDIGLGNITLGYYMDVYNEILEIYTTNPGWLIGASGVNVQKLEKTLLEEYHRNYKVKFIEIRGGFLSIG